MARRRKPPPREMYIPPHPSVIERREREAQERRDLEDDAYYHKCVCIHIILVACVILYKIYDILFLNHWILLLIATFITLFVASLSFRFASDTEEMLFYPVNVFGIECIHFASLWAIHFSRQTFALEEFRPQSLIRPIFNVGVPNALDGLLRELPFYYDIMIGMTVIYAYMAPFYVYRFACLFQRIHYARVLKSSLWRKPFLTVCCVYGNYLLLVLSLYTIQCYGFSATVYYLGHRDFYVTPIDICVMFDPKVYLSSMLRIYTNQTVVIQM